MATNGNRESVVLGDGSVVGEMNSLKVVLDSKIWNLEIFHIRFFRNFFPKIFLVKFNFENRGSNIVQNLFAQK